jgi:hypothetical protein
MMDKEEELKLPPTLYFSLCLSDMTDDGHIAMLGEIHYDEPRRYDMSAEDRAYNEWVEAIEVFEPEPRAFRLDVDVETGDPEAIREVTDDFRADRERLMRERGIWQEDEE